MKKEIRQISDDGKTIRISTPDERWYVKTSDDGTITEYPSVTWITDFYPKGIGYYRWLADKGWDNAETIMKKAGNKGTKVHRAISSLLLGNELKIDEKFPNSDTGEPEEIAVEEWEALMSFRDWHKAKNPHMLVNESVVFNEEHRYAGTVDFLCLIDDEKWLIDFKTRQGEIFTPYELQLAAYAHALPPEMKPDKLAILQIGYKRNKAGWKLTEYPDQFDLFLSTQKTWKKETEGTIMFQKDFPISLTLS